MKKIGLLVILMMILVAPFAVFAEEEGDKKDIPLVDLNEKGDALNNTENLEIEKEKILSEGAKTIITLLAYFIVIYVGYASESIITVDNFNGSTANNYLSLMLPALFFIKFSKDK